MRTMIPVLSRWLSLAVAITMLATICYAVVQQVYRQDANDPQIMMAEDIAAKIESGQRPDELVSRETVDPSRSLAPFVIVFDAKGGVEVSGAQLNGKTPVPPGGVLEASKASGENRVTWQPRPDARIASVIVPIRGGADGYVLAGRSLRVVEERISRLGSMALAGWIGTLVATLAALWVVIWFDKRGNRAVEAGA